MNPFELFENWFSEEKKLNNLKLPAACCLSTTGLDGYPNARLVSLKEILNESFVITGPLSSRKGIEIQSNPKASLTFWWTSTERQIRIQGDVITIPEAQAALYFKQRSRDSQIVSTTFSQGEEIPSLTQLRTDFETKKTAIGDLEITCPNSWGGIYIKPIRIEFMEFKKNRLHERKLYQRVNQAWEIVILQP